ncbi:BON domain-containing protein [Streptomyces sp. NPDC008313]|uniref:BON domain-containing protein n=1 Tax=Streptomyces sp. NPDC008313 TaxID=3364826 RepID=UPI0036F05201
MNDHAGHPPAGAAPPAHGAHTANTANTEYRIAHLRERLAAEELGELGMRVEPRGSSVAVIGTVPTTHCREELVRTVDEELAGLAVHYDVVVADATAPDHPEEVA